MENYVSQYRSNLRRNLLDTYSNAPQLVKSLSVKEEVIEKAEIQPIEQEDIIEKGRGKNAEIGERREHSGKVFIKTATGWVYQSKSGKHMHYENATKKSVPAEQHHIDLHAKHIGGAEKSTPEAVKPTSTAAVEPVKAENSETIGSKTDSKIEKKKIKYLKLPKEVENFEDFKKIAFTGRNSLFKTQGSYKTDQFYDYKNSVIRRTLEVKPSTVEGKKEILDKVLSNDLKEKLSFISDKYADRINVSYYLFGKENMSNKKIDSISQGVTIQPMGGQYFIEEGEEVSKNAEDEMIETVLASIKYDKTRVKDAYSKVLSTSDVGIGRHASSSVREGFGGSIDMTKYIDKFGQEDLEQRLNKNYAWKTSNNTAKWEIKNKHIVFRDTSYTKYD